MGRFILKRVLLSLVTLLILSVVVFLCAQVLPGDVGRSILGPFADQKSVDALNEELGANDPLPCSTGTGSAVWPRATWAIRAPSGSRWRT